MAVNRFICCYGFCFEFRSSYFNCGVGIILIPGEFTLHTQFELL